MESVEIKPAYENFDVILNSKDDIKVKKAFSKDKMVLTLKNTTITDGFSLKYSISDLDNVLVKRDKKDTKIIIKSKNIIPPKPKNHAGLLCLLGIITLSMIRHKNGTKQEETKFIPKRPIEANLDYIIQHKLQQKAKEKIEIAA